MKRDFIQVIVFLICIQLIGCPYVNGEVVQETDEGPKKITITPTWTVEASPDSSSMNEPTTVTDSNISEPTGIEEPEPTGIEEMEPTEEKGEQKDFDLEKIGFKLYREADGIEKYEASTCFFDDNGLLCVALNVEYDKSLDICEVEKSYYFPNSALYKEKEVVYGAEKLSIYAGKIVEKEYTTKAYEPIAVRTVSGYVWTSNGTIVKATELLGQDYGSKFSCTSNEDYITVSAGETIKLSFYFSWFPQIAGIVFLDGEDRLVAAYSSSNSKNVKDEYIVVPEKAEKMHLTLFANQKYKLEREITLEGADLQAIPESDYLNRANTILSSVTKSGIKKYSLDKAYITFVLDDCRPDMDKVADVFEQNGVPLCIAAVWENLLFPASKGEETRFEVCERVVAAGGEVLVHDAEVITEELLSDYNKLTKHFYEDKWILEQLGFDVNGIVLAGGNGQVVGHEVTDIWARAFYKYSDLYGEEKYGEPYYHRRWWLKNCTENYEKVISGAIEAKEWVVFYLHDLSEVNSTKLQEILQYISSLPEEDIAVVTYKSLYDMMWNN